MNLKEQAVGAIHPWVAEGTRKLRIGVHLLDACTDWQRYCDAVQAVEGMGFDSVWVADHPTRIADCWTVLSVIASKTTTLHLGSLVSCALYRHPALLARITLDIARLSNGRLVLGLGMGDAPEEFQALGLPPLSVRQRQKRLEETIQVVKALWSGLPVSFEGEQLQVQAQLQTYLSSGQQPPIPLLLAGGGERSTLRQVAEYADISNFGAHSLTGGAASFEDVRRKCQVLQDYCHQLGRDPQSILRSYLTMPFFLGKTPQILARKQEALPAPVRSLFQDSIVALQPQEAIDYFRGLIEAGIQYVIVGVTLQDIETLELLSTEVSPMLLSAERGNL
jgi:alkanesulfonate monooxygenase SsuD/methylene tetrahydromethanopterin reductase-like flavin-dependent oxidoreductase (luciferase family)